MIVSGVMNSGCERSGGLVRKIGQKRLNCRPAIFTKKSQKSVKLMVSRIFLVDLIGIEPTTLRMRTVRSPS